jgi:hypothetical protein
MFPGQNHVSRADLINLTIHHNVQWSVWYLVRYPREICVNADSLDS